MARSLQFKALGKVVTVKKRRHINIGEVKAALRAEEVLAQKVHDVRYVHLQDSQVSIAACTKRRSSSPAINRELRMSVATYLGAGLRPSYGYLYTKDNPADDRARQAPLRAPVSDLPHWGPEFLRGSFEPLDAFLGDCGLDLNQLRDLPDPAELVQDPECVGLPSAVGSQSVVADMPSPLVPPRRSPVSELSGSAYDTASPEAPPESRGFFCELAPVENCA